MKVHTLEYVEAGVILPYNSLLTRTSQMEALINTDSLQQAILKWLVFDFTTLFCNTVLLLISPPPLTFMHDEHQRHGRR